jgi:hypothetical protein
LHRIGPAGLGSGFRPSGSGYVRSGGAVRSANKKSLRVFGLVAPVDPLRRTENPRVGGSIPPLVTTPNSMKRMRFPASPPDDRRAPRRGTDRPLDFAFPATAWSRRPSASTGVPSLCRWSAQPSVHSSSVEATSQGSPAEQRSDTAWFDCDCRDRHCTPIDESPDSSRVV